MVPRTRKIVMTVFCLEEDAEDVKRQLFDGENQSGFFYDSNYGLANVTVEVLEPTPEEDRQASDHLDVFLEGDADDDPPSGPSKIASTLSRPRSARAFSLPPCTKFPTDDVEGWRNEVRRRTEEK